MLPLTCVQLAPVSRVTQTLPSSVPAHSSPASNGDSSSETIVQYWMLPMPWILAGSLVVRSELISVQFSPRKLERSTTLAA